MDRKRSSRPGDDRGREEIRNRDTSGSIVPDRSREGEFSGNDDSWSPTSDSGYLGDSSDRDSSSTGRSER